ncbi:MAG: hypothetical protein K8T26_01515 [Lentisphaerae bacterium]|nr:hypothetical protein [Lentisphaerota bacterium]
MKPRTLSVALCGPSDVAKEMAIAAEVLDAWNQQNWESRGVELKHKHWSTDAAPDAALRPQEAINRQFLDDSTILVAIFWSRFGSPTGLADSGTQEEIIRAVGLKKRVLVYFSDLQPTPPDTETYQLRKLEAFRDQIRPLAYCKTFSSRAQFRSMLQQDITLAVDQAMAIPKKDGKRRTTRKPKPQQTITGNNNIQAGRDVVFNRPPTIKPVLERRPGSVTPEEVAQIKAWIETLAEGEVGMSRQDAYSKWGGILLSTFKADKRESLLSSDMNRIHSWFKTQRIFQANGLKTAAPEQWRNIKYGAIKAAMKSMGRTNEEYYPVIAERLGMKKPFGSLKELTKRDLGRVYNMVLGDSRKG